MHSGFLQQTSNRTLEERIAAPKWDENYIKNWGDKGANFYLIPFNIFQLFLLWIFFTLNTSFNYIARGEKFNVKRLELIMNILQVNKSFYIPESLTRKNHFSSSLIESEQECHKKKSRNRKITVRKWGKENKSEEYSHGNWRIFDLVFFFHSIKLWNFRLEKNFYCVTLEVSSLTEINKMFVDFLIWDGFGEFLSHLGILQNI